MTLIEHLNEDKIAKVDISELSKLILEPEFQEYFLSEPGREQYKLLAHISSYYKNKTLIDIGTYKGCSALALSYDNSNRIYSFDTTPDTIKLGTPIPNNIQFIVDNIISENYRDLITQCPFIFLDTNHDGTFEIEFLNYLTEIKWSGYLLLDDIHLNDNMMDFWNGIEFEKIDISYIGHHSGTGLVLIK